MGIRTHSLYVALLVAGIAHTATASTPLEVRAVEVRLFRHHSGSLSEPLTGKEVLWNTIIGEGGSQEPSSSSLVDVVVAGTPGTYERHWVVELVVKNTNNGKVITKQRKTVGVLSPTGQYHIGFWLSETGCEPLSISAHLKGGSGSKEALVPFECGE